MTGDNLGILSARKGLDPRKGLATSTGFTYTALRSLAGGVALTF